MKVPETKVHDRPSAASARADSAALLAEQVSTIVGEDAAIRGGELPLWQRLSPRKPRSRLFAAGAWCVVLALLLIAVLRIVVHDAVVPLIWLNAFTLYVYLPAYIALIYASWTGRWWLATASAAVFACHLSWVLPDFLPARPYRLPAATAAETGQSLRVFYANVRDGNLDVQQMLDEALAADADVIILSEVGRYWLDELRKSDISLKYPYGTDLWHRHGGDVNVFSRRPVSRLEQITIENRATIAVDIPLGEETLRLFAVHSPRPRLKRADNYDRFWEKLTPIVAAVDGPVILIGDCNATQHSLVYERLNRNGLRSAHDDRGRGSATTWPNGMWPVPPIRIDQAFLSRDIECFSIREGTGLGSDHKPIVVDFVVHPREPGQDDR